MPITLHHPDLENPQEKTDSNKIMSRYSGVAFDSELLINMTSVIEAMNITRATIKTTSSHPYSNAMKMDVRKSHNDKVLEMRKKYDEDVNNYLFWSPGKKTGTHD